MKFSKYHSKKTVYEGEVFDSKGEAERYRELVLLQRAGEISGLARQPRMMIIPSFEHEGKKEGAICYRPDFVYREGDKLVYEDFKGFRTEVYRLKRKLFLLSILSQKNTVFKETGK